MTTTTTTAPADAVTNAAAPLTTTPEEQELAEAFAVAVESMSQDERRKLDARIAKSEKRQENDTSAESRKRAQARARATKFVLATWRGLTPQKAAVECGFDLSRNWGDLHGAILCDPRLDAVWRAGRASVGERLVAKASGIVESELDGAPIDKFRSRTATFILDRGGFFTSRDCRSGRAAPTAAAQVVINFGGSSAVPKDAAEIFRLGAGVIRG